MRAFFLLPACVVLAAGQTPPVKEMPIVYKEKGLVIRAPANTSWCEYGKVRLQNAVYVPDPRKDGKQVRPLNTEQKAAMEKFLRELDDDLQEAVAVAGEAAIAQRGSRTMEIRPQLHRLSRNSRWLNAIGLAALQTPLKGSSLVLELPLADTTTHEPVGSVLLQGKSMLASQVDLKQTLKRFRYSFSQLGQAHSNARAGSEEGLRQIYRLSACATEESTEAKRHR